MVRSAKIGLALAATMLAVVYYFLLISIVGRVMATHGPAWWYELRVNRHVASTVWLVAAHTIAVLTAALPIAIASVTIADKKAVLLASAAGALAVVIALVPMTSATWSLVWAGHPYFFVADQIKIIVAVPLAAWVISRASSHFRRSDARAAAEARR